ncbi:MAG TPA: HAD family hydrolase [Polaromonas sp.]|nr:HAD family hydrolase [Polaromonas sp.]
MNTNAQIRAVIFDVDGTLFDTLPSLSAAANDVLAKAGMREVSMSLLRSALNEGLRPMFRQAIALQSAPVDAVAASQLEIEYMAYYERRWLSTAPLFAGVTDALAALKSQGLKLGVCTNRDRASTDVLLASASIADSFDAIVSLGDAPLPKPAADPLLLLMERMEISASEALFVGDSGMDACCAQLSKVRFAAHLGGYAGQPGDLLPNVLSFAGYEQLTSWVLDHRSALFHPVRFTLPCPINLCH